MNIKFLIGLAWSGLIASVTAGVLAATWLSWPAPVDPVVLKNQLLANQPTAMQVKLHRATDKSLLPGAIEHDFFASSEHPESHILLSDGGTIDRYDRADGSREILLEFYPPPSKNERGKLKHATKYGVDGVMPLLEISFRADATREMTGLRLENGNYRSRTYFAGGIRLASETLVGRGPEKWNSTPQLLLETRWSQTTSRVSLTNVLNQDMSRDITSYDENVGSATEVSHMTQYTLGSTLIGYYPGTTVLRVSATSTSEATTAYMFWPTGKLWKKLTISSSSVDVLYFDETGTRQVLDQMWFFTRTLEDGFFKMKDFKIYIVTTMNERGEPLQQWDINEKDKRVWSINRFNRVVDGIHWKEVYNFFDMQGLLDRESYIPDENAGRERKYIDHKPEEGIRGVMPPDNLMIPPVIEGNFALPFPQTSH